MYLVIVKKSLIGVKFMTVIPRAKQTSDEKCRGSPGGYYGKSFS
jgi:hypothetical protein